MSDYPTVPQPEANFMAAAEQAIEALRADADDAAVSARISKAAADRAEATAKKWHRLTVALGFAVVLLFIASVAGGYALIQTRHQADLLRTQSTVSCQIGNDRAAGTVAAFHELVVLSENPHPAAAVKAKTTVFENFVLSHNKQRDCQQAYSSSGR